MRTVCFSRYLVPRTRSAHHLAAGTVAKLRFTGDTRITDVPVSLSISKFARKSRQMLANFAIGTLGADSDEGGQAFRFEGGQRIPIDGGQHSDEGGQRLPSTAVMGSCVLLDVKSGAFGGDLSHAFALEGEPVGVVDEPVENGVGDGRIGDHLVPVIDRQLAGHDGRAAVVPILDDLKEVATLLGGERWRGPNRRGSAARRAPGS